MLLFNQLNRTMAHPYFLNFDVVSGLRSSASAWKDEACNAIKSLQLKHVT